MKIKITQGKEVVIETEVTSLNIYEDGCVEFQVPDNCYYITTQGIDQDNGEGTLWFEKFKNPEDLDEPTEIKKIPLRDVKIDLMLNSKWEEIPLRGSFLKK
ncbi:hypothetical protein [uncultured Ilyobacter sp.]|uniref:hypothetical protein n=1 Tax=uncultured Ilyobacter sp. TaxID=544433 RepID=UPI0029C924B7|nr:hypothetical protein [uncultured Ilyobacter sp.]